MENLGHNNSIKAGARVALTGSIKGSDNVIEIAGAQYNSSVNIRINGNGNHICIAEPYQIHGLSVHCGNHVPANGTKLAIGANCSFEPGGNILLYNHGNSVVFGDSCMVSTRLTLRCGESPHLIFDLDTGAYLDISNGVVIGRHVWIGEDVYLTKRSGIPDECVVAARSVVTRRFDETNALLAGNPARIAKRRIQWIRNRHQLEPGTSFYNSFHDYDRDASKSIG